ncbi:MAG: hypothetical protein FWF25_02815 [Propionibacteriaceae bacterium]|nr:hypothetical protein [Propionibacteriaceae bacterium]
MADNKLVWRSGVFKEIRSLPTVKAAVNEAAQKVAAKCGTGYEVKAAQITGGRGRARAEVVTRTYQAMRREARDHTLLKAGGSL